MSSEPERPAPLLDPTALEERKRQVARRLRRICPDIPEAELGQIVERIARTELEHDLAQHGITYAGIILEPSRRP